jgi:F5/8 type C domain
VWNSRTGGVQVLDGSGAQVVFKSARAIPRAENISLRGNERIVDMFQKAGVDLTSSRPNLAEGQPVTASFTTSAPALRATAPEFAVDGFTISGLPSDGPGGQARPGYLSPNPIWGACSTALPACGDGSPDNQQWLAVDLQKLQEVNAVKLYFFSDKSYNPQQEASRDTYRQPASYTIQVPDGNGWVDVPGQVRTPDTPQANYNLVTFPKVTAGQVRVLMTRTGNFGIGVKEIQIFGS